MEVFTSIEDGGRSHDAKCADFFDTEFGDKLAVVLESLSDRFADFMSEDMSPGFADILPAQEDHVRDQWGIFSKPTIRT